MSSDKRIQDGLGMKLAVVAGAVLALCASASANAQVVKDAYSGLEKMELLTTELGLDTNGASGPVRPVSGPFVLGFEGPSQYNAAAFARNFIPPDTMGAVGRTQFVTTANGVYGVYDKSTGANLALYKDTSFWASAGQTGTNGDSRILYNAAASRWIALSFGNSVSDIQIAVSNTDNALGTWQSTKFTGFAGGTADYPTLAMDKNAVYIGTNNFGSTGSFQGTTLNVIPLNSLFNSGAPTVANSKSFVTPYDPNSTSNADRGYAIQGVNSRTASSSGTIVTNSLFVGDNLTYKVNGLTANSAGGASLGAAQLLGVNALNDAGAGRQPNALNPRVIDALDQRIGSSVYEANGKIYSVQTVDGGTDYARVRYTVIDAGTNAILDQGDLGSGSFDYYQGSIAVNSHGSVVIGFDRSGSQTADLNGDGLADGNVTFMAQTFWADAAGKLHATSNELTLKVSLTSDYHNGSLFGQPAAGRQRWGDYSQVTLDPTDENTFWAIGEFAREYNNDAGGHPGGSGGSRWGTFVAEITTPVPEVSTYAMMLAGLASMGALMRRRRA
jgi:hypothetical protein